MSDQDALRFAPFLKLYSKLMIQEFSQEVLNFSHRRFRKRLPVNILLHYFDIFVRVTQHLVPILHGLLQNNFGNLKIRLELKGQSRLKVISIKVEQ